MAGVGNGGGGGGGAIRAGRAFVELYAEDNRVYRALDRLKARFQSFAGFTLKAGVALGAGGLAALAPLKGAIDTITEQGKLGAVADAFGLSAEEASRLFGIMQSGGSDLRDATEGLVTLGQRVNDAMTGTGKDAKQLFADLGVSAAEFDGLNPAQQFYKLVDSLQKVGDPAKRVQLLLKAVGEDTGKNLIPVLGMSAQQLRDLGDAFQQSGADVQQARATTLQYTLATAKLSAVWRDVSAALAPAFAELLGWLQRAFAPFAAWVKANRAAVLIGVQVAAAVVGIGVALVGLGLAAKLGAIALGGVVLVLKGIALAVSAILSPVGLLLGAIGGLGYLFFTQTQMGRTAASHLGEAFRNVGATFSETWGGIKAAVQAGDLELAFKIAGAGIRAAWFELLKGLTKAWADFGRSIVNSPLGKLDRALGGVDLATWEKLFSGFEKLNDAKAKFARAELALLVDEAKRKAAMVPAGAPVAALAGPGGRASVSVGSRGSFSAAQAAQRFSLFDDVPLQQLKEAKKANAIAEDIKGAIEGVAMGLAFK